MIYLGGPDLISEPLQKRKRSKSLKEILAALVCENSILEGESCGKISCDREIPGAKMDPTDSQKEINYSRAIIARNFDKTH
jgi:hypothetical protein